MLQGIEFLYPKSHPASPFEFWLSEASPDIVEPFVSQACLGFISERAPGAS